MEFARNHRSARLMTPAWPPLAGQGFFVPGATPCATPPARGDEDDAMPYQPVARETR